jgi:DNA-binding NarL/FixJ family response regulator
MSDVDIVTNAEDGLAATRERKPELVLMDIGLPDRSGLALGRQILAELPLTKIVALTVLDDEDSVQEAQRIGFCGYLSKQSDPGQFNRTIAGVMDGQVIFPQRARRQSVGRGVDSEVELLSQQLTNREIEVLQLLSEGKSSRQIAERLRVSPNTVRTHVQGILTKLQVHSRLEAAAFAVRHRLVKVRS